MQCVCDDVGVNKAVALSRREDAQYILEIKPIIYADVIGDVNIGIKDDS